MVMAEMEAMERMMVHEEAAIGMEMEEGRHGMKEEAIEIGQVHMIALIEGIACPLIVTNLHPLTFLDNI